MRDIFTANCQVTQADTLQVEVDVDGEIMFKVDDFDGLGDDHVYLSRRDATRLALAILRETCLDGDDPDDEEAR
jgi:hypothetical protein